MRKNKKYNIQDWCKEFRRGNFSHNDVDTQCNAGWYDWFCKDSSLPGKTRKLGKFLMRIRDSKKLEFKHHIWFKNNCPCSYPLYDDIRFTDEELDCNAFVISFNCGYEKAPVVVTDVRLFIDGKQDQEQAKVFQGTVSEAIKWFNS